MYCKLAACTLQDWNAATCILGPDDIPMLDPSAPDWRLLVRKRIQQRQQRQKDEQQPQRRRRQRRRRLADEQPPEQTPGKHDAEELVRSDWHPAAADQLQAVGDASAGASDQQSAAAQDGEQPQASAGDAEQPQDQQQEALAPEQPACRPGRLLFRLRTIELSLSPLRCLSYVDCQ
jgi:hypothetical protein